MPGKGSWLPGTTYRSVKERYIPWDAGNNCWKLAAHEPGRLPAGCCTIPGLQRGQWEEQDKHNILRRARKQLLWSARVLKLAGLGEHLQPWKVCTPHTLCFPRWKLDLTARYGLTFGC